MNACRKNRKAIALLSLGVLRGSRALEIREHFEWCAGCRRYWQEMSNVRQALAAPQAADIEVPERFYDQLETRLRTARNPMLADLGLRLWDWRIAVPAGALLLCMCVVMFKVKREGARSLSSQSSSVSAVSYEPPPTIASYKVVASQSLERFSELLDRQGEKPLPPAPIYTASGGVLAKSSL